MLQRVDVTRREVTYLCNPKNGPSCGGQVGVQLKTCPTCKQFQRRPLAGADVPSPVTNTILYDNGQPVCLVAEVGAWSAGYIAAQARKWATRNTKGRPRLSGLGDRQAMFGTLQPQPLRQRYGCTRSQIARESDPDDWLQVAQECQDVLGQYLPEVADRNVEAAACVNDCWKWAHTGWTSGVLNLSQLLPYHRDAGNLKGSWSAMIGARSGVTGGNLYLPEYDTTVGVGHRSLVCFPGAEVTHGVTPFFMQREGWRVTAVFYGLSRCAACLDTERSEMNRAAQQSTVRARAIATGQSPKPKVVELMDNLERSVAAAKAAARQVRTEGDHLKQLAEFARLMVESRDLEPWAGMLRELYAHGDVTRDEALWLVKLYNAYDALGSAWGMYRRWPTPEHWNDDPAKIAAAQFPCTQERRNLRGGKVVQHLQSFCNHISGYGHERWLKTGLRTGRPGADFLTLADHVRKIWGVGRQSAFEWCEFLEKVTMFPIVAPNAMLWESEGPRRALQRLYGNPSPTPGWLDARAKECRAYLASEGVDLPWEDFETVICDFNVMRDGRYYVGRHLAALREEINEAPERDRAALLDAWGRYVPAEWQGIAPGIDKAKLTIYRDTGTIRSTP